MGLLQSHVSTDPVGARGPFDDAESIQLFIVRRGRVSTFRLLQRQFASDRQSQIRVMLSESLKGVIAQVLLKKNGGGRVPAREVLLTNDAVSNLIREGKTYQLPSIIQTQKKLGMHTLNDSLIALVEQKIVEPDEAYMKSVDKTGMEASLRQRGIRIGFKD